MVEYILSLASMDKKAHMQEVVFNMPLIFTSFTTTNSINILVANVMHISD